MKHAPIIFPFEYKFSNLLMSQLHTQVGGLFIDQFVLWNLASTLNQQQ